MTKEQFLKQLDAALTKLPSEERGDIIRDYKEYFFIGMEEGKTEQAISASLGHPRQIAKELLANYRLVQVETTQTAGNMARAAWAVVQLGFFHLAIVAGPLIAVAGIMLAGWCVGIFFIASPLLVVVNAILTPGAFHVYFLFNSILFCGAGIAVVVAMMYATKAVANAFVSYLKYNVSLVKGGLKRE